MGPYARRVVQAARPRRSRLRDPRFWYVQAMLFATALFVHLAHLFLSSELNMDGFHDLPIMLFVFPMVYAAVVFGLEGAVLTGAAVVVLALPHALVMSTARYEWMGDVGTVAVVIATSSVLAAHVERERIARRRAEAVSSGLRLLNDLSAVLAQPRMTQPFLQEFIEALRRGLDLDRAWIRVTPGESENVTVAVSSRPPGTGNPAGALSGPSAGAAEQAVALRTWQRTPTGEVVAPLMVGERVYGALGACRAEGDVTDDQAQTIVAAAHQASVAIDNMRLEREHRKRLSSYARQVTNAQEEERRHIARELHDGVTQALSGLCRGLDLLQAEMTLDQGDPPATAAEIRAVAAEALRDIRRVVRDLRPMILDDLGMISGIEWLVADFQQRTGVDGRLQTAGEPNGLSAEQELTIFRVVQEALRNVEKHAGANHVCVDLSFDGAGTHVQIRDDGRGFRLPDDFGELGTNGHYGLLGMQERAMLNAGTLTVHSDIGAGTSVRLEIGCQEMGAVPSDFAATGASLTP